MPDKEWKNVHLKRSNPYLFVVCLLAHFVAKILLMTTLAVRRVRADKIAASYIFDDRGPICALSKSQEAASRVSLYVYATYYSRTCTFTRKNSNLYSYEHAALCNLRRNRV